MAEPMRVAVTLEQCWHRVPGGTARAAVETTRALLEADPSLDLVGVSARHRHPAPPPFEPPIDTKAMPFPRRALYDCWHHLRHPSIERVTGPVDVIHATGLAMPPATAPIVWTLHDLAWRRDPTTHTTRGVRFFEKALELARTDAAVILCSSQATLDDAIEAGLPAGELRLGAARRPPPGRASRRRCGGIAAGRRGPRSALRVVGGHGRAPQEPRRARGRDASTRSGRRRPRAGRRRGLEGGRGCARGAAGRPGQAAGLRVGPGVAGALRRSGRVRLPEPLGGLRAARARGDGPRHAGGDVGGDRVRRGGR